MFVLDALKDAQVLCTGCGACVNSCTTGTLTLTEDDEGFLYPKVDATQCSQCEQCLFVYPSLHPQFLNNSMPECYIPDDSDILSGLCTQVLRQGGVVFGAAFDTDWHMGHMECHTEADLTRIKGITYLQSNVGLNFRKAKAFLDNNRLVLFMGTPCQIAALYGFLQNEHYDNLVTAELLCRGMSSYKVFRKYLQDTYPLDDIADYTFGSGHSGNVTVRMNDGREYRVPQKEDAYVRASRANLINRPSCGESCLHVCHGRRM